MLARTRSFGIAGLDAYPVTIEVDVGRGLPSFTIVGLPDTAIRESKERVRSAIKNSDFEFPSARITVNLAPADIKKAGPAFDLAMAVGILAATEQVPLVPTERFLLLGELSLGGQVKPIPGALSAALAVSMDTCDGLVLPKKNAAEAALARTARIFPVRNLHETVRLLQDPEDRHPYAHQENDPAPARSDHPPDFQDVKGQAHAKRGLEIAAAGGHNALLIGPPGSGKTMLARRFPFILPAMTREEALEVTRIHSVAGTKKSADGLIRERPFRSPHHTSSNVALIGGGPDPRPGEVTLAHNGVLFLDELPEFNRNALESLRQPLEDQCVTIARAQRAVQLPARFTFLAAMNPCPCGNLTNRNKICRCSSNSIHQYLGKISGPLLDRIDLHLEVPAIRTAEILGAPGGDPSRIIRKRTVSARERQLARFQKEPVFANAQMSPRHIRAFCGLDQTSEGLLRQAVEELGLSARAHDKVLKVARTIADLADTDAIRPEHLAEAISYRYLDKINL